MKLKVGDRVQLRIIPPFDKAGRVMQAREKGVVTDIKPEGYTVEFEDSMTPVVKLTEDELDLIRE